MFFLPPPLFFSQHNTWTDSVPAVRGTAPLTQEKYRVPRPPDCQSSVGGGQRTKTAGAPIDAERRWEARDTKSSSTHEGGWAGTRSNLHLAAEILPRKKTRLGARKHVHTHDAPRSMPPSHPRVWNPCTPTSRPCEPARWPRAYPK